MNIVEGLKIFNPHFTRSSNRT